MKRRISEAEGLPLIQRYCEGDVLSPTQLRTAVRFALEEFSERYPGKSVEIRIPWIGATQAIAGINRGGNGRADMACTHYRHSKSSFTASSHHILWYQSRSLPILTDLLRRRYRGGRDAQTCSL